MFFYFLALPSKFVCNTREIVHVKPAKKQKKNRQKQERFYFIHVWLVFGVVLKMSIRFSIHFKLKCCLKSVEEDLFSLYSTVYRIITEQCHLVGRTAESLNYLRNTFRKPINTKKYQEKYSYWKVSLCCMVYIRYIVVLCGVFKVYCSIMWCM